MHTPFVHSRNQSYPIIGDRTQSQPIVPIRTQSHTLRPNHTQWSPIVPNRTYSYPIASSLTESYPIVPKRSQSYPIVHGRTESYPIVPNRIRPCLIVLWTDSYHLVLRCNYSSVRNGYILYEYALSYSRTQSSSIHTCTTGVSALYPHPPTTTRPLTKPHPAHSPSCSSVRLSYYCEM